MVHRYVWEQNFGKIPEGGVIHHINGNKFDNRIENLRDVCQSHNCKNKAKYKSNSSGEPNISINKSITVKKKYTVIFRTFNYSKSFLTLEEAIKNRDEKYIEFGFHENHGS